MLDLTQRRTTALATVASLGVKRAGSVSAVGSPLAVRVTLASQIESNESAEVFDKVVPGTLAIHRRRIGGGEDRARLNRSPADLNVIMSVRDPATGDQVLSIMGSVERISYVAVPKFAHALFQIKIVIDASLLGVVADYLEREVEVSLSTPQQVLPFVSADDDINAIDDFSAGSSSPDPMAVAHPESELREVVSYEVPPSTSDEQAVYGFGLVESENADEIVIRDFDVVCGMDPVHIVSRFPIHVPPAVLRTYQVRCGAIGRIPSWADLIPALGEQINWASSKSNMALNLADTHVRAALGHDETTTNDA